MNFLTFPGGEPHCRLIAEQIREKTVIIDARIGSMQDFGMLLVAADAIHRSGPLATYLFIPYFPGARQDVAVPGVPLTVNVYAQIINDLFLQGVFIVDPHSAVTPALVHNCHILYPWELGLQFSVATAHYEGIICPDAGAEKRVNIARHMLGLEDVPVYHGRKTRDPLTGKLSNFAIDDLDPFKNVFLMIDDICDGGGTFIELAKIVYSVNPLAKLDLMVTHGIFSKGTSDLLAHFRRIYTTDSFPNNYKETSVSRLNLFQSSIPVLNERCKP
jgi:ribose-phosphate pyrophosphokinase